MALDAVRSAARADPPLKPNHPTQSIEAPIIVNTGLCGGVRLFLLNEFLLPKTIAMTNAPTPAVVCTTIPPAKSFTPICPRNPPPHTQ